MTQLTGIKLSRVQGVFLLSQTKAVKLYQDGADCAFWRFFMAVFM